MLELQHSLVNILPKAPYTGSHLGMRYYITSYDGENISAFIYPQPFCFEATPDEKKTEKKFPLSLDGINDCAEWLKEMYDSNIDVWKNAKFIP